MRRVAYFVVVLGLFSWAGCAKDEFVQSTVAIRVIDQTGAPITNADCGIADVAVNSMQITNNVAHGMVLSQRLGSPVSECLLQNKFVIWKTSLLRREGVTVKEVKRLLKYSDGELDPASCTGYGQSIYFLPFTDVRCVVEVAEEHKSIYDDATLVNVTINTNNVVAPGTSSKKRAPSRVNKD